MSKSYGTTCDRCKVSITSPVMHYKLKILSMLDVANVVFQKDLCLTCKREIEDAFQIVFKDRETKLS